jgi:hypothetical protein
MGTHPIPKKANDVCAPPYIGGAVSRQFDEAASFLNNSWLRHRQDISSHLWKNTKHLRLTTSDKANPPKAHVYATHIATLNIAIATTF